MRALPRLLLARIAFRSFFLQSSWNYRGMMSMGFLYSIRPGIDQLHSPGPAREAAYMRHLEYFNTNPYFASVVMGVTLALEERLSHGEIGEEVIHDTKEGLMTACAAIGDGLFWDSWRPFVAVVALIFAFGNYLLTPLIFLVLYNLPHLYFRFAGIFWGYREGTHVIKTLRQFQFPQIRQNLRLGTMVLLAYLIPNHVNVHTPFLLTNLPLEYFYFGEKVVQGLGALLLVTLGTVAYRARVDVLLISFLLMVCALVLYHWGILI
ncbi:MAG TPA: PTS system mannose/fructose/sorbose family transporter subunit IID [Candidatus Rifleibacterium sp.]|nr:PTS system mannose/fructose/sorbose family transporter subunit IID [Candidatus Rifleibacterium sp.]HPT46930.1 PTS system mannose/fructose/sorbose family transporter subunit IID [Candidatus Rifleibacterium sp.]